MTTEVWLATIPVVAIGLFGLYFKSYIEQRGKILATKADVDLITQKVETVKSQLGILTHRKISIETEKQNTLLELNAALSKWLNFILLVSAHNYEADITGYYESQDIKINEYFSEFLIAESKVEVFFNGDIELLKEMHSLKMGILKMSGLAEKSLLEAKGQNSLILIANKNPDFDSKVIELEKLRKELYEMVKKFIQKRIDMFEPISHQKFKFSTLVANRLYSFIKP